MQRKALVEQFDRGDIKASEFEQALTSLFQQERGAASEIDRVGLAGSLRNVHTPRMLTLYVAVAFLGGFFISPWLYPRFFGYKTAEECMLQHSSNVGASACMQLYPGAPDRPTAMRVDQPERE